MPRAKNELPPAEVAKLVALRTSAETAEAEFRAGVVSALQYGSVRQVAAAAGLSPTTVIAWAKGEKRR